MSDKIIDKCWYLKNKKQQEQVHRKFPSSTVPYTEYFCISQVASAHPEPYQKSALTAVGSTIVSVIAVVTLNFTYEKQRNKTYQSWFCCPEAQK